MSSRGSARQQGSFQGQTSRKGPSRGDRHGSGYWSGNSFPDNYRHIDDAPMANNIGRNYSKQEALLRTPPPPSHLHSPINALQLQAQRPQSSKASQSQVFGQACSTNPYHITVSINAPPPENLSYPGPVHIPCSTPGHMQPTGAMIHPDPPPPYTPYPEESPLSSSMNQMDAADLGRRKPKMALPQRGKGNRMRGNFSQSVNDLMSPHQFDEAKREQPGSAMSNSNFAGERREHGAYNGKRGCFPSCGGSKSKSISRDKKEVSGFSVKHDGDEFSDTPSTDGNHSVDGAFCRRGRGGNRHFNNQGGRGGNRHFKNQGGMGQRGGYNAGGGYDNRRGRRKSYDRNSVSQDDRSNSIDSINDCGADQELCVQLYFATCFEKASLMKEHIQYALNAFEDASFELSYEEILLEHKLGKSSCKFTVTDRNISSAEKYVRKMVDTLEERLQISINSSWKLSDCGSHDPGSDGSKKAFSCHPEAEATASATQTVKQQKKKRSRSKQASSGKENKSEPPVSIPTILCFAVEKSFSSPTDFKTFLRNATSSLGVDFEIDGKSIDLTAENSNCLIKTKSKADARRLQQYFAKQTQLCIQCNIGEKSAQEQDVKEKLDKAKSTMLKRKSELLQKHEERISQNKKEVKKISSALHSKEGDHNFKAIHLKLSEAIKQRDVFMTCFDKLYKDIELSDISSSQEDNINQVKHLFNMECNQFSSALPIYAHKDRIIYQVESTQISIIVGENGCGKSTQIPQYLFDAGLSSKGTIVCTQPSQLTALSLADRVSKEKAVKVGSLVGYKTEAAVKATSSTKILYATDLSLLNEFHEDPDMKKYSCIIVDEAHEHSLYTDLLLGMIKSCLPKRPDLKIIIVSVPGHQDVFIRYFKIRHELEVSSANFTVDAIFTKNSSNDFEDYENKAVSQALKIHAEEDEGDILIFVSLTVETLRCCQEFERRFIGKEKNFQCLPLHSKLPPQELKKVFDKPMKGQRKIIFATKFAETSFRIDSVKYTIDSGVTSETKYDPEQKVNLTTTCPVSQLSALQRRMYAGHSQGGKCFHLYSKEDFDQLNKIQFPEILRVHLEKAILKLYELNALRIYEFVQAPSEMAMDLVIDTLTQYGAIDNGQITMAGKMISKMPFDPKLGYLISEAHNIGLLYDAIVLAAIVSLGSDLSYRTVSESEAEVNARNKRLLGFEKMDSFAWLHVYKLWSEMPKGERSHWCRSKSINYKLITSVRQYIEEIQEIMKKHFKIEFKHSFSEKADAMVLLKSLYRKCKHSIF